MSTKYSFGFDLQYSEVVKTDFEVLVECRLVTKADPELSLKIINQNDDSEINLQALDLRDRAMIWDKAWTESDKFHTTLERG